MNLQITNEYNTNCRRKTDEIGAIMNNNCLHTSREFVLLINVIQDLLMDIIVSRILIENNFISYCDIHVVHDKVGSHCANSSKPQIHYDNQVVIGNYLLL